ncbi:SMAD/FHA domain-containing protein [Trametopsis cervina]|nr:SMAD/FHA domain-containing protein [Trametopsis cervina]
MDRNSRSPRPRRDDYRDKNRDDRRRDYDSKDRPHLPYGRRRDEDSFRRRGDDSVGKDYRSSRDTGRNDRDRNRDQDVDRNRRRDDPPKPSTSRRSASPPPRSLSHSGQPAQDSRSKSKSVDPEEDKAKPNFGNSGLLAAATKTVKHSDGTGTVLKYHEPPEARKPLVGWRLYVFKGKEQVDLLHIHRQSAYLIGRDRLVADITIDHPSCSKQHAVIQFRQVHERNEFGDAKAAIKPFVIDLESTNGTQVNDAAIPTSRYYELKLGDVLKFGDSAREYVLVSEDAT